MWELLKQWFNEHRVLIGWLLLISVGMGLFTAGACFFFPSVLVSIASFALFGITPFAFLTAIQLPLALIALGVITAVVAFGITAGGALIINQLISLVPHLWGLCDEQTTKSEDHPVNESYSYLKAHLITTDYIEDVSNDYDDDISSSNSSEHEDVPGRSSYSRTSSRSSLRLETDDEHSTFISFSRFKTI